MSYRYKGKGSPDLFTVWHMFAGKQYYAGIHTKRNIKRKIKGDWKNWATFNTIKILKVK